ncbi:hypothetical protein ACJIZ3_021601 [Penstemon smallii]|uniref:Uncharacterized protein n=1 Tax=Penstemon smallii TaxID=265156 RepID=A0ABD3SLW5_9LAMI
MEGYFASKMKRKELEDVNEDFSDFSLSSPARKIRRLDAELAPIVEEEEGVGDNTASFEFENSSVGGLRIEELLENEERAIVLFNPTNNNTNNDSTLLLHSPSNFSVSIDPQFASGLKNQILWSGQSSSWKLSNDEAEAEENNSGSSNGCLAVVPWVPQLSSTLGADVSCQLDNADMMDAEETGEASMDIEDGPTIEPPRNGNESGGVSLSEGIQQWQQQHCMIPQPPPNNNSTPIVWYQ